MLKKNTKDIVFIENCISLGKKAAKLSSPNPGVGCLIVKNNKIISYGYTSPQGRPHAEQNAIAKVKNKDLLKGSYIYISLEPCFHIGKTEPCVDLIIKHRFSRVIIATIDPDHRVSSKSIAKLQENNISVDIIEHPKAKKLYRKYFKNRTDNLPFVTVKVASSADGKIALKNNISKWITTPDSRKNGHYLRFENDAILIGKNTLVNDDPSLDCRIKGLEKFSPAIILLANKLDFNTNYKIFNNERAKIIFYRNDIFNNQNISKFSNIANLKLIPVEHTNGNINLTECLKISYKLEINNLLIEGGSTIITEFLKNSLIDEIYWYRNNKILGGDCKNSFESLDLESITEEDFKLKLIRNVAINESDSLQIYSRH